jgi:exodeoxyribonuclease-3
MSHQFMENFIMKIASFNANSIRARMAVILKWIDENRPDVLCIQETKVQDKDFPVSELETAGYKVAFKGEKSYNGVATLSLAPFDMLHYGFDGNGDDDGTRLIISWINGVPIVNSYVPQGTDPDSDRFQYKLGWFESLRKLFMDKFSKSNPLIWVGDFNVAPEPIDVHDPKRLLGHIGFHPDEHRALSKVKEWGFIDVFRKFHPEGGQYTFYDYRVRGTVERGLGWRVDHIWATEIAADKATGSWIDLGPRKMEKPSDHTFIVAEFKF